MNEPPPGRPAAVLSALAVVLLLATLDQTIVATALPAIVRDLGDVALLSWVVAAYLMAGTVVGPIYGKLGDIKGRKAVLQVAIGTFLLGSMLCGVSRTMLELVLARTLQGVGGGGLVVTVLAVVGDMAAPRDRAKYQSYFGMVVGLSTIAGPALGGYFVEHLSWRWIFFANLPIGLMAMGVIAFAFRRSSARRETSIDYAGALLLGAFLICVALLTDAAWSGALSTAAAPEPLAGAALIMLAAFVAVENRARDPIIPLRLFRDSAFTVSIALSLVIGVETFTVVTFLPLFMQAVKGMSASHSGMQLIPLVGGMVIASAASGMWISRRGSYKRFPVAGMTLVTMAYGMLYVRLSLAGPGELSLYLVVLGLGLGLIMPVLVVSAQNAVAQAHLGVATSMVVLFRSLGGALGVSVFGALFARALEVASVPLVLPGGPRPVFPADSAVDAKHLLVYTQALEPMFLVGTVLGAVGLALALMLREKPLAHVEARSADI